jgi:hypothetical protein
MLAYTCLTMFDGPRCPFCGVAREEHFDFSTWTPPPIDDEYREKRSIELIGGALGLGRVIAARS